jgi:hypothetical protein
MFKNIVPCTCSGMFTHSQIKLEAYSIDDRVFAVQKMLIRLCKIKEIFSRTNLGLY